MRNQAVRYLVVLFATTILATTSAVGQPVPEERPRSLARMPVPLPSWPAPPVDTTPALPTILQGEDRPPLGHWLATSALASLLLAAATVEALDIGCERLESANCDLPKLSLTWKLAIGFLPLTILVPELPGRH